MKALIALVCVLILVSGVLYWEYSQEKERVSELRERVNLPVNHSKAIEIATSSPEFKKFAEEHFTEGRIERAMLEFNPVLKRYIWRVEILERACGCAGLGNLTAMVFLIDPEDGRIIKYEERVGVREEELARETCEQGCH